MSTTLSYCTFSTFLDVHVICKFLIYHRDVKAFKELNMIKKSNNY